MSGRHFLSHQETRTISPKTWQHFELYFRTIPNVIAINLMEQISIHSVDFAWKV